MKHVSDFRTLLREKGIRATTQRLAVLDLLKKQDEPISISELEHRSHGNDLDTTTFYRTLETLVEAGLVRKVNLGHAHMDYELVEEGEHHHHVVCTNCGRIEDFVNNLCESLAANIKKQSSFQVITNHSVELFGLCRSCA